MARLSISEVRDSLPSAEEPARTEAVFLERYGRRAAVLLSPERYEELMDALEARDPRPPASRALKGRPGYRLRVGDYRLGYTVQDDVLLVVVITVGHHRDVYDYDR